MSGSEGVNPPAQQECPSCGSPISPRARLCPVCRQYRREWKNWLSFYGSGAGVAAIVASAATFLFSEFVRLHALFDGHDAIRTISFEYPGDLDFVNTGDHDLVIQSLSVDWTIPGVTTRPLQLPVNQLIKPGEFKPFHLNPFYVEPVGINTANWVYGKPTQALLRDAFDIGNPKRCSVFHIYNTDHAMFEIIDGLASQPGMHLATWPADVKLIVYHTHSGAVEQEQIAGGVRTAFLAIDRCLSESPATPPG
jgi:hypothetical protein